MGWTVWHCLELQISFKSVHPGVQGNNAGKRKGMLFVVRPPVHQGHGSSQGCIKSPNGVRETSPGFLSIYMFVKHHRYGCQKCFLKFLNLFFLVGRHYFSRSIAISHCCHFLTVHDINRQEGAHVPLSSCVR